MAAVYLDCGLEAARGIILRLLTPGVEAIIEDVHKRDYKSSLQEITQARHRVAPQYLIVEELGSEHDKTFLAHAVLNNEIIGQGQGKSKKEAEQAAARNALENLPAHFPQSLAEPVPNTVATPSQGANLSRF